MQTVITGTGSFIPPAIVKNSDFASHSFYDRHGLHTAHGQAAIIAKFEHITGIAERRYADNLITASDMAAQAATAAIADAGIDAETLDQLIVAHNFGDAAANGPQPHAVPSLASRVKHKLGIQNPACVAYDIIFGCPGWLQGLIQGDAFGKAGMAKRCLVIGTETLSRVIDRYDRDSMIFSDGAGAVVTEWRDTGVDGAGILGFVAESYAGEDLDYIGTGKANGPNPSCFATYIKMHGRKVYEFALKQVPAAIKTCLEKCNIQLADVKKVFIHQANEKMDEAIVHRLFKLYGINDVPAAVMPMNIQTLGNSSVATIPTLLDMVRKGVLPGHTLHTGDIIVFASVGAGMNINAACYRV